MVGWKWMGVETLGRGCCRAPEDLATIATAQGDPRTLLDLKLRATDKKKVAAPQTSRQTAATFQMYQYRILQVPGSLVSVGS